MKTATNSGANDIARGNNYVSQATLDGMNALIPTYEAAYNAVSSSLSQRSQEVRERDAAIRQLETYVRDFWEVLRRRINRLNQPAALLQQYGLPLDGATPKLYSAPEWLTAAGAIVAAEATAVANGYPAMVNPSAAEVQTQLTAAQSEQNDIAGADRTYDQA